MSDPSKHPKPKMLDESSRSTTPVPANKHGSSSGATATLPSKPQSVPRDVHQGEDSLTGGQSGKTDKSHPVQSTPAMPKPGPALPPRPSRTSPAPPPRPPRPTTPAAFNKQKPSPRQTTILASDTESTHRHTNSLKADMLDTVQSKSTSAMPKPGPALPPRPSQTSSAPPPRPPQPTTPAAFNQQKPSPGQTATSDTKSTHRCTEDLLKADMLETQSTRSTLYSANEPGPYNVSSG
ncbi:hypothetical protein C8R45DRAFT_1005972 [Mycena sanguinolenta]|nr:hypothetical protein C8R45DRAFT_1005972 [Mycena sanguinolenta]